MDAAEHHMPMRHAPYWEIMLNGLREAGLPEGADVVDNIAQ